MSNILRYKGYFTKINYSAEDKVLHGKIEGINDLVTFESNNANQIEQEFHKAVDDYLSFGDIDADSICSDLGTKISYAQIKREGKIIKEINYLKNDVIWKNEIIKHNNNFYFTTIIDRQFIECVKI
jgi:hypothetical protein